MKPTDDRCEIFAARVREHPENPMFRFSLGQALVNAGRNAEAVPHLRLAAASRADWMVPRILLGKAYQYSGDVAAARAAYEEALALARSQGHEEPEEELVAILAGI